MFLISLLLVAVIAVGLSTYSRLYALLFLIPLSIYSQSSTVVSIGERGVNLGMDTIYIFIFVIVELAKGKRNKFNMNLNKSSFALLLCFVYFLLNSFVSSFVGPAGFSLSGILACVRLIQYVPVFILLCNIDIDLASSIKAIKVFIITGLSASFLAVYQLLSGNYFYMKGMPSFTMPVFREIDQVTEAGSYAGSGNYNVYAAFLLIPVFLAILLWYTKNEVLAYDKKKIVIYLCILIIGMYISSSRSAALAIIVGLISMNFSFKRILPSLKKMLIISVLTLVVGYLFRDFALIKNFTDIITHFNEVLPYAMENSVWNSKMGFSGDTLGAVIRIYTFTEAIRVFLLYPFFGCGFDLFLTQSSRYPENLFLQILAETGIIGFFLFLNFIYTLYTSTEKYTINNLFDKYFGLTFQAIIIALCFVNMTGGTLFSQKVWGPFLIIAGFFYGYKRSATLKYNEIYE
jgi:hypothetical protein